jgi:NDP-sugar pyrophosphorylase family protein
MTSFLQLLIDDRWKVKAVEVSNGWLEIDSVEDLEAYEGMASRGELSRFFRL